MELEPSRHDFELELYASAEQMGQVTDRKSLTQPNGTTWNATIQAISVQRGQFLSPRNTNNQVKLGGLSDSCLCDEDQERLQTIGLAESVWRRNGVATSRHAEYGAEHAERRVQMSQPSTLKSRCRCSQYRASFGWSKGCPPANRKRLDLSRTRGHVIGRQQTII
ncbi:hypothetical protein CIHG_00171 [Coccidioides immitis H538.4]|uniref:Uncharacterized protein n=3 Tax=Coccidioides immitis TaxID=5501 RepID=A0A0J8QIG4_COCIT|nr:hypothetical protein CIRG_06990 [Coccidioides immitis RMSCC 2394]KMU72241.1 hypothetical protein CISG_00550 [Coccidioides immitis RMSCC 3703]KMU82388.1 hypothetical protein CIHG_00171 [Coccidioides immitis H538.4]